MADSSAAELCPVCQRVIRAGMPTTACPACGTIHHYACWREHNGCAAPGCTGVLGASPAPPAAEAPAPPPSASPAQPVPPPAPLREAAAQPEPTPPVSPPTVLSAEVEVLLAEMYLRLREGLHAEVRTRLDKAKQLAPPDHPAILEVEGDLALAVNRLKEAEDCYRRAFQADPGNALLEEKFAAVIMKMYEPQLLTEVQALPDDADSFWSNRVARPVWAVILFSLPFPGLGQFYTGDWLKGLGLVFGGLIATSYSLPVFHEVQTRLGHRPSLGEVIMGLFSGWHIALTLLLLALWVYGIVDAVLVARAMQAETRSVTPLG
ncbi:MAG: RING finger protein [Armatimonadota bacterium]